MRTFSSGASAAIIPSISAAPSSEYSPNVPAAPARTSGLLSFVAASIMPSTLKRTGMTGSTACPLGSSVSNVS